MKSRSASTIVAGVSIFLGILVYMLAATPRASAIPAFSQKYQTSCNTCHNNSPELNDFGEAFKKNGFKFPKDDETFVKEPPVLLGAKAQKEAFPNAIYPGEIPGNLPIAFRYSDCQSRTPGRRNTGSARVTGKTEVMPPGWQIVSDKRASSDRCMLARSRLIRS